MVQKNAAANVEIARQKIILSMKTEQIKKFKADYDARKKNFDEVDQIFVDSQNPVDFIEFIENISDAEHINSKISVSSQTGENQLFFQIRTTGNYVHTFNFVRKLETGPFAVEINQFNVSKLTAKDSGDGVIADISISVLSR
ncbi:MAG: hypothetical protein NTV36_02330 [Candidatus Staskawiczbacteria bacterium]|nr:hypothetical protein [Candidatus Staskawiczbacteria bacterium]